MTIPEDYEEVCQQCNKLRIDCACVPEDECLECGGDLGTCDCGDIADL